MTPKGLLPHPKPAEGTPSVHASLVNLSIRVKVLLRLMSPRAFSSRQGVGVFKDFVQFKLTQGSEIVRPEGTMAGTIVPKLLRAIPKAPPGSPGLGSVSPLTGKPALLAPPGLPPGQATT